MSTTDLRERLAAQEHTRWAGWMAYMFTCGTFNADGSWTMPPEKVRHWQRQVATAYAELTEREKDSDRIEADKTLALLQVQVQE